VNHLKRTFTECCSNECDYETRTRKNLEIISDTRFIPQSAKIAQFNHHKVITHQQNDPNMLSSDEYKGGPIKMLQKSPWGPGPRMITPT
jgi:hypothetical protein